MFAAPHLKRLAFLIDVVVDVVGRLALVVLPPVLFYASGYYLNSELQVGFGLIIYPFLVGVAAVATLYVRVFLLDHVYSNPRRNSLTCVVVACAVATALGVVIPPLYE
jgi:hypothetical protein